MEPEALYFNPNIHPLGEYRKRRESFEDYARDEKVPVRLPEYDPSEFFCAIEGARDKPKRCSACWYRRLQETARVAKQHGFEAFSTTLLVSPFQDQDALRAIGSELAAREGIAFYYEDFRVGFRQAQEQARLLGLYRQTYCGCLYSGMEKKRKQVGPVDGNESAVSR